LPPHAVSVRPAPTMTASIRPLIRFMEIAFRHIRRCRGWFCCLGKLIW
jgi:hypothetical protein